MSDTWLWMTAADLGRAFEAGEIDPREVTEVYLSAIESHPQAPGIYARVTADRARAEADAAAARARAGLRHGPLDGVPVSWKDLFDTAGTATEAGSALLAGRVPERDAAVLAHAGRAGLVCLGKTHLTELAFSGIGINPVTATPPNINDPELAPGGSSSGAAASVAFGLAAAGIGSDTGGSIRVPSSWNDLVGLKPTHGLLSLEGVVQLCPRFDTPGPLCRSVEDAALLLAALSGAPAPDLAGASLDGASLLVLDTAGIGPTADGQARALEAALDPLRAAGARTERAALASVAEAMALAPCIFAAEAYGTCREVIEARPELMFAPVLDRFRSGEAFSAPDYVAAWQKLDRLRAEYLAETAGFDAVVLPTTPNLAPNVEALLADHALFMRENLMTLRNTRIGNLMGLCALSLPSGTPGCGLMVMAAPGSESRLLRLGAAIEAALGA
ncbi:MAG TPA: amidase family protein [Amaricoccus sp.]|uniref:amidase n=1 Tax=Amaricoccus sp. TaxID=1872485 RepID=UPI002CBDDE4E|nr:amidase family protein [Amaricoccus sp.]HMQ93258.1 amidase family protein [Amaricoccus sp.]HMR54218.1 amidase family protein [Amaricoccus sp.]HMR60733.1 amidase family protein [Amaricoccus sp.]HMU01176.1 amidase family protein [Amaricoccus sp.]